MLTIFAGSVNLMVVRVFAWSVFGAAKPAGFIVCARNKEVSVSGVLGFGFTSGLESDISSLSLACSERTTEFVKLAISPVDGVEAMAAGKNRGDLCEFCSAITAGVRRVCRFG